MIYHLLGEEVLVARAPQRLLDGVPVRDVARDRSDVHLARTVVELKKDDKAARRMAIEARNVHENHLCPSCLLEHWTYVLTKYNSRFGLRFLDLPATLALLDAKARGEVAVGV